MCKETKKRKKIILGSSTLFETENKNKTELKEFCFSKQFYLVDILFKCRQFACSFAFHWNFSFDPQMFGSESTKIWSQNLMTSSYYFKRKSFPFKLFLFLKLNYCRCRTQKISKYIEKNVIQILSFCRTPSQFKFIAKKILCQFLTYFWYSWKICCWIFLWIINSILRGIRHNLMFSLRKVS